MSRYFVYTFGKYICNNARKKTHNKNIERRTKTIMAHKDATLKLHNLKNVNTVLSMLYDESGNYRAGFSPDEFYNTILLDTLKYGEENYVHLKYAENLTIKKGYKTARFRRWAGMTPTLRPLLEGVPPMPDKHAYETMEIGNVWSFGRWSEYTDQIDASVISDVVSERSLQYGELANQIKELYARKIWLSSPNEYFAKFKAGFSELAFGDAITLDDLRFLVARMKRMQVKPIGGKFNYICSPEFINGLIDDPRVVKYMELEQTTGKLWTSGEPFDLFELTFIPTMLDEFAYPDTEFPGVYELSTGKEAIRLYAVNNDTIYYLDVHEEFEVDANHTKAKDNTDVKYLPDGTAIDEGWVKWEIPKSVVLDGNNSVGVIGSLSSTKVVIRKATKTVSQGTNGNTYITYSALAAAADATDLTAVNALIASGAFTQLPVHRGILFGDEALVKLSVEGVSDAPRMIVKPLGSSGVADPLDQRQSIGFRVDGFGLAIKRPEAICVTYGIPVNAELAALTIANIQGEYTLLDGKEAVYDTNGADITTYVNYIDTKENVQVMHVDGVNDTRIFLEFVPNKAYSQGTVVTYAGKYYVFIEGHKGTWNTSKVREIKIGHELPTLDKPNDDDSNVK